MTSSPGTALTQARWTHVALPTGDLDRAIAFYTEFTPLMVVQRFKDDAGERAWLSNEHQVETPFVMVLVSFNKDKGGELGVLKPFAHIGIEVPHRSDVDALAKKAREMGVLYWEPQYVSETVGYVCALRDPDGNVIEISTLRRCSRRSANSGGGANPDDVRATHCVADATGPCTPRSGWRRAAC